ncbi:MAG TPA: hypothetical protein VJV04_11820 [Nitrospiraceae bacterium]|nr:hypothetical protein [Nitrospiraceae bacterium]
MKRLGISFLQAGVVGMIAVAVLIMPELARVARAGEPMAATSPHPPSQFQVPFELFKTWDFDREQTEQMPAGFSAFSNGNGETPTWIVAQDPNAQTPPNLLKLSASCSTDCSQILLVDALQYEYLDLLVRVRLAATPGEAKGEAGVVFGARDHQNYYAVTIDLSGKNLQVTRVQEGKATVLADSEVTPKPVVWHLLRVRRNTIISKEYIEVFFDGAQIFSVEDKTFGAGRIGLITRGAATAEFDNLTAAPLYSQKPLSGPAAY